jgi:hypothetical protein
VNDILFKLNCVIEVVASLFCAATGGHSGSSRATGLDSTFGKQAFGSFVSRQKNYQEKSSNRVSDATLLKKY